jgi:potassium-dependent mechanosensitive channel
LAERPVKVGDWIAIGDLEGDIRRINVRATEIEMGDRSRLIVPNSELVSKMVRNVTHGASLGRVKIVLSLDAKSDPLAVRDLLMERLSTYPGALTDPPPSVYLTDIKDGAMEFTAFVYLTSPREAYKVKSDLLFQIVPNLKAQGIAFATSNPVVHVDMRDRPIEPNGARS